MIRKFVYPILLMVILLPSLFNNSCKHEPQGIDQLDTVCFQTQILPVIQTSCGISGCHDAGSRIAGFQGTNYTSIMEIVSPGSAAKSKRYKIEY